MASPQKENGYTAIANEIIEHLVELPLYGREMRALLFVIRKTYGYHKKADRIPLSQFERALNTDRSSLCKMLKKLVAASLLVKSDKGYSFNKNWNKWVVATKPRGRAATGGSGLEDNQLVAAQPHSKETLSKEKILKETNTYTSAPKLASVSTKNGTEKPLTPLQQVVNHFYGLKGWPLDKKDARGGRSIYARFTRPAGDLLALCDGDVAEAKSCLDKVSVWAKSRNLDFSIETVFKKWHDIDLLKAQEKKAFIGDERAFQYQGRWYKINANGEKFEYVGDLKAITYR